MIILKIPQHNGGVCNIGGSMGLLKWAQKEEKRGMKNNPIRIKEV